MKGCFVIFLILALTVGAMLSLASAYAYAVEKDFHGAGWSMGALAACVGILLLFTAKSK
jgi:hypothetical protein